MWVIPKQLTTCPYVQDTVELISDCDQKSKILEQSAMWRSKRSPLKTWSRRLKAKNSTLRLYTRILKHSHSENFVDAWTSSLVDSPVSPSQAQGKRQGQKTLATSSHTSSKESQSVNPTSCSSKTLKESSVQNSKVTNGATPQVHPFCYMSLESWKEWVTNQRLLYSLRLKSEPLTKEEEFLLWESEKDCLWSEEQTCGEISKTYSTTPHTLQNEEPPKNLGNPLAQWATPTARDWKGGEGRSVGSKEGTDLPSQVDKNWPTPPASQRGEDYTAYLRKCINRVKAGGAPFAPTLQVAAENPKAETSLFKDLDLTKDTEQLIKEIKGRGWPTPKALEIDESVEQWQKRREKPASKMRGSSLTVAVKIEAGNWATPTTRDWKGAYSEESQKNKPRNLLPDQAQKNWTTPIARDCFDSSLSKPLNLRKDGRSRVDTMPRQVHHEEKYRGKLNPRWVETLMGLDVGWVMPDTVEDVDLHTACTNRTDELRLLGNGVVPQCASRAFVHLWARLQVIERTRWWRLDEGVKS